MTTTIDETVAPYAGVSDAEFAEWTATARAVAAELADTAVERDRANDNPVAQIQLLRSAGLLGFATPRQYGGAGGNLSQALKLGRIIAAADGSIGQLITYHYSNGVWTYILGTAEQWEYIARGVGEKGWFQASVSNPRDEDFSWTKDGDDLLLHGTRTFATGVALADLITISAYGAEPVDVVIAHDREGIAFGDDWDNLGQRLSASGSVTFDTVRVHPDEVLGGLASYDGDTAVRNGLRALFSQLIFAHLYLGIAEGALEAAVRYVRQHGRPGFDATVDTAVEDPYIQQLLGRHSANLAAGVALADAITPEYEGALAKGPALTESEWGRLAVRISQAKSVATEVSLATANEIFQATGARSTSNAVGLDIYWRNLRTHTVHDAVVYRQREIGRFLLTDEAPTARRKFGASAAGESDTGTAV